MRFSLAALLLAVSTPLAAHDFWIEPSDFRPAAGTFVDVRLKVGENFEGEPVARNAALVTRFSVVTQSGEAVLEGRHGSDPAGRFRATSLGVASIVYRGRGRTIELEAAKFEQYLEEEGLTAVIAERRRRGEERRSGREVFSRCAKSLIAVGPPSSERPRVAGLTLEIVPEVNPYALRGGDDLPLQVLFEGKPLPDVLVTAMRRGDAAPKIARRSDENGRVVIPIAGRGEWLLKTVHMRRAAAGSAVEWESVWSSLTFDLSHAR